MKRLLCLVTLAAISCLFAVSQALAADIRGAGQAEVRSDEIINDDLYIAGTAVNIAGTVNGDVVAGGGSVTVSGHISGNLFAAAQTVTVSGRVDGGVFLAGQTVVLSGSVVPTARVAAQTLLVQGQIGRDLLAAGQTVSLESQASVGQDVLMAAEDGRVLGSIGRKLTADTTYLTISGKVSEASVTARQELTIASGAAVGNLTYRSGQEARIESGATVTGTVTREPLPAAQQRRAPSWTDQIVPRIIWLIGTLIAGAVIAWIAPAFVRRPAAALYEKPWQSLGWGAILFVVTPFAVLTALVTVVGIPIGLLVLFAYLAALFLSQVFVGLLIGRLILQREPAEGTAALLAPLALGLLILMIGFAIVGFIPVLGGLVSLAVLVFGLGGAWIAAGRLRLGRPAPAEA